jgi:hypothetical protein
LLKITLLSDAMDKQGAGGFAGGGPATDAKAAGLP